MQIWSRDAQRAHGGIDVVEAEFAVVNGLAKIEPECVADRRRGSQVGEQQLRHGLDFRTGYVRCFRGYCLIDFAMVLGERRRQIYAAVAKVDLHVAVATPAHCAGGVGADAVVAPRYEADVIHTGESVAPFAIVADQFASRVIVEAEQDDLIDSARQQLGDVVGVMR